MKEREEFNYPPFLKLIKIEFYHKSVSILNQSAKLFTDKLKRETDNEILGPEFGIIDRLNNYYFKSTLVKSKKGKSLILVKKSINDISKFIKNQKKYKNTKIVIDVDPC